jgi:ABC-type nitrate/sulfonate/bicarbonate transport system permease component
MTSRRRNWWGIGFVLLLLLIWETVARLQLAPPMFFPPVSTILSALWSITISLDLVREYGATFWRAFAGFTIGTALGVTIGLVMGFYRPAFLLLEPLLEMLRPIPTIALIPVAILALGIGDSMKIFVIAWACFFPVWINALEGVLSIERGLIDTALSFRLSNRATLFKIALPFAVPGIFTGMRISVGFALIVTVVAEMIAGQTGVGRYILDAQAGFQVPDMYAAVFSLGVVGLGLNQLFLAAERRLFRWRYLTDRADIGT